VSAGLTGRSGIIAAAPRPRALRSTCSCIFVLALVTASFASTASTHVVMVTAAIPAVKASNDTHAIAFAPTQITRLACGRSATRSI
jgi:hypothetical protein